MRKSEWSSTPAIAAGCVACNSRARRPATHMIGSLCTRQVTLAGPNSPGSLTRTASHVSRRPHQHVAVDTGGVAVGGRPDGDDTCRGAGHADVVTDAIAVAVAFGLRRTGERRRHDRQSLWRGET